MLKDVWGASADFFRVLRAVPEVECGRFADGPAQLVWRMRARGRDARARNPDERRRLRRLISLVDRILPGAPSCYRRALLEMGLDAGAAKEPLHLGLRVPGGPRSGNAWLGMSSEPVGPYDVQLDI